ncbi:MAG: hydantoinase/oxoprolinase family protein [Arenicellales bacterium]|nr:hydantoinase/oxoprolinase family protein [Arenicellales bacterium]
MDVRLGIDVGGTFTDFVLVSPATNLRTTHKEASTPQDPSLAVERGLFEIFSEGLVSPSDISVVVHGTTLGLNAILQKKGCETALVVSKGNKDVLELARGRMPSPYNFLLPRDEPLIPRDRVLEVGARSSATGAIITRPDSVELDRLAEEIRALGVRSVAVALINAYVDPALEHEVADALERRLSPIMITPSTRVWPEIREYERAMLAVMNAYIHPLLDEYYVSLANRLTKLGLDASLYITASNGGTLSVESARQRPVDTLLSGPASGVVATCALGADDKRDELVAIDMGGTSCDMSITRAGQPVLTTSAKAGGYPLISPTVDVSAIGAGGGSILWLDNQKILKVGPHSAGADPGPASYGRGGLHPTITDCFVAIGLIDPEAFLGGRMRLDREAAINALDTLAAGLGFGGSSSALKVADSALRVAIAMMSAELYKELAQRGVDPRGRYLMAYGGAGPTLAAALAQEAKLGGVLVPMSPGTLCAYGAITSQVRRDFIRSVRTRLPHGRMKMTSVEEAIQDMEKEAQAWASAQGDGLADPVVWVAADMRYVGQAYELEVVLSRLSSERGSLEVSTLFHEAHAKAYGFPDNESDIEIMNVRLSVVRPLPALPVHTLENAEDEIIPVGRRSVFWNLQRVDAVVFSRSDMKAGHMITGPAIVEQQDTTTWLSPGWNGRVLASGTLELQQEQ